jgi:DNA-binding NtrC family response regulator
MVSTRIVTSSSANILEMVDNGTFREDLYARLTSINLALPPLRDTKDDIEQLAIHHISKEAKFLGLPFIGLDPSVVECLRAYPWLGNINELRNECRAMAQFSRNGHVIMDCLPVHLRLAPEVFNHGENVTSDTLLGEAERIFLLKALAVNRGDVEIAGKVLGLSPEVVIKKTRIYGLDPMDFQNDMYQPPQPKLPGQTSLPNED